VAPEAKTAVDGAGAGGHDQRPTPVLREHSAGRRIAELAHRIFSEAWHCDGFCSDRQHLAQQRVAGVPPAHTRHESSWYSDREPASCRLGFGAIAQDPWIEIEQRQELIHG
jgi:hypothetical protein